MIVIVVIIEKRQTLEYSSPVSYIDPSFHPSFSNIFFFVFRPERPHLGRMPTFASCQSTDADRSEDEFRSANTRQIHFTSPRKPDFTKFQLGFLPFIELNRFSYVFLVWIYPTPTTLVGRRPRRRRRHRRRCRRAVAAPSSPSPTMNPSQCPLVIVLFLFFLPSFYWVFTEFLCDWLGGVTGFFLPPVSDGLPSFTEFFFLGARVHV